MLTWTPALATGDERIDRQHQEIFRRVDALHQAMLRGDATESGRLFEFLGTYVGEHFAAEEKAMAASGYPAAATHRAAHTGFVRAYLAIGKSLEREGTAASVTLQLKSWLTAWLKGHILDADVELARHLVRARFVLDDVA